MMLVNMKTAFVKVAILCLFVSFVYATEQTESEETPLSLKYQSGNETECDCGPHGECKLDKDGRKECDCDYGFPENNGFCERCDCGLNGICSFNESVKRCRCFPEYGENNGTCTECSCYVAFQDLKQPVRCFFENGVERCKCPKGYKEENTTCIDIDECLDPSSCPFNNTMCWNQPGDFFCPCQAGYVAINGDSRRYGCRDEAECELDGCPHNDSSSCVNNQGKFYCECKPGYSRKHGTRHIIKALGCEKDPLGTGYIVLIIVAVVVVVGAVVIVVQKRCYRSIRKPGYRTGI